MSVLERFLSQRRRHCEEQRRRLAELEALARRLRADSERLQLEIEQMVAGADRAFAGPLIERHRKLERSVAAVEAQIAAEGDALAAVEQELKQHELAAVPRNRGAGLSGRRLVSGSRPARPARLSTAGADSTG